MVSRRVAFSTFFGLLALSSRDALKSSPVVKSYTYYLLKVLVFTHTANSEYRIITACRMIVTDQVVHPWSGNLIWTNRLVFLPGITES